jgi:hypothetical protein
MDLVTILVNIGLPAVIISALVGYFAFREQHLALARWSGILFLSLIVLLAYVELIHPLVFPKDLRLDIEPEEGWKPFSAATGLSIDVVITAQEGEETIADTIVKEDVLADLQLALIGPTAEGAYTIRKGRLVVGKIPRATIIQMASAVGDTSGAVALFEPSSVWETGQISSGESVSFEEGSSHGSLGLKVEGYNADGTATIALTLNGDDVFTPSAVEVPNKGLETQTLQGLHEFLIVMPQADFTRGKNSWAKFVIVGE